MFENSYIKLSKNWKKEVEQFLEKYNISDNFFIYDILTFTGITLENSDTNDIIKAISIIINLEHSEPEWIGRNPLTDNCCIGLEFTKGNIKTETIYTYKNNSLQLLHDLNKEEQL